MAFLTNELLLHISIIKQHSILNRIQQCIKASSPNKTAQRFHSEIVISKFIISLRSCGLRYTAVQDNQNRMVLVVIIILY